MLEREDVIAYNETQRETVPAWLQERLEWFQDLKFGLILHWGPYALWDCCESWPLSPGAPWARNDEMDCWTSRGKDLALFQQDYWALNKQFNPVNYDPHKWASLAKKAGIKYVSLTSKHHDGFCMWDTETTEYRITGPESPFRDDPRADVYKGLCDAFQAEGLAISVYFSKADWHCPDYWSPEFPIDSRQANTSHDPERWKRFVQYTHDQIRELMSNYGKIDILWLDAGWVKTERNEDIDMSGMVQMARKLQPDLLVANRTVGDEFEDFITPEHEIPTAPLSRPWESCLCMAQNWKYHPRDTYRSTAEILEMLIDIVSKGGNFLIGIGPTPDGEFTPQAIERLEEIAVWMETNSEAIHGTRAVAPYRDGHVKFTSKGEYVYAFLMEGSEATLAALRPRSSSDVEILGCPVPPKVLEQESYTVVTLPLEAKGLAWPPVLKYRL